MALSLAQHSSGTGVASATATITVPPVGELIVVCVDVIGNVANITPPTGYTAVDTANNGTTNGCKMYYRISDGTESTSCTATCTSATATSITYDQYHSTNGAFQAGCLDKHSPTTNTSGTSLASGSITPTTAAFVLACCLRTSSSALTNLAVTNSFVVEDQPRGSRDNYADRLVSGGSGSYSTTWSWTASSNTGACCIIANFKEPASAAVTVSPTGITTGFAAGTADAMRVTSPAGVATGQAFGTADALRILTAVGVATRETFGAAGVLRILAATGIVTAQQVGTPKAQRILAAAGIQTGEASGTPKTRRNLAAPGAPSAETFGAADVLRALGLTAIASAETVGTARLRRILAAAGIQTGEQVSAAKLLRLLAESGIPSREAFGTPQIGGARTLTSGGQVLVSDGAVYFVSASAGLVYHITVLDGALRDALVTDTALLEALVSDTELREANVTDA